MQTHSEDKSYRIEQHVRALRKTFVPPQRFQEVVLGFADFVIVEHEPTIADLYVGHIVAVVFTSAQVHHHAHQFVHRIGCVLAIGGFQLQFEGKWDLPDQFGDASFDFVIFEPPQVYRKEVRQGLDVGGLERIYEITAFVAFELVPAGHLLLLVVVAYTVIERHVGLRQHQTQVDLFLLPLRNYIIQPLLFWQT